jgi:protein-S-isoprenylcysteine O-methyltransferase Ste14
MSEFTFYQATIWTWFGLAAISFLALQFIVAPYGRHTRKGWGPTVSNRLGWILMEAPTLLVFDFLWLIGDQPTNAPRLLFIVLWHLHYVNRTLIFPFRIRGDQKKRMPALIMLMGMLFNTGNAYIQARWIFHFSDGYGPGWLSEATVLLGIALFLVGYAINLQSDAILRNLRKPGETGHKIPRGGLYRWISCPNYFGELVEWTGWALATGSLGGVCFVVWTAANLVPRAQANHRWYQEKFPDYPPERRAVFPGIL